MSDGHRFRKPARKLQSLHPDLKYMTALHLIEIGEAAARKEKEAHPEKAFVDCLVEAAEKALEPEMVDVSGGVRRRLRVPGQADPDHAAKLRQARSLPVIQGLCTGRLLTTSDPPLQNIPIPGAVKRKVDSETLAPLLKVDFAKLELHLIGLLLAKEEDGTIEPEEKQALDRVRDAPAVKELAARLREKK